MRVEETLHQMPQKPSVHGLNFPVQVVKDFLQQHLQHYC